MKKIVSICLFLFVCFFIFSADTHILTITASVPTIEPIFSFAFTTKTGSYYSNEFSDTPIEEYIPDLATENSDLYFFVGLLDTAKCYGLYSLTFNVDDFQVSRSGETGTLSPSSQTTQILRPNLMNQTSANKVEVVFTGTTVSAGNLVVFELQYKADSTLDANVYKTNIYLELAYE